VRTGRNPFNLRLPTLGGRQFWGDVLFFRGYRIQQNALTGHFRLLSPTDVRLAWGRREHCQNVLDQLKIDNHLAPMSGRAVVLIHGIFRSSKSFAHFARQLATTADQTVPFDYPSTRVPLSLAAGYLDQLLQSLEGIHTIDFVVHSMGGLLVRTWLQQQSGQRDSRLHRMVMLGVPNQGAQMANLLHRNPIFRWTYGPAGQQLVEGPAAFVRNLPVPDFPFAIVAGGRGDSRGWNPLISGDDDGTVSVGATRLQGAADFIEIPTLHSTMMWNSQVISATIRFLQTGALREDGLRHPVEECSA